MCSTRRRCVAVITRTSTGGRLAIGADSLNFTRLEEAQEQRLHAQAHLADFVHEDRSAVGRLEPAALVAMRVGEAALHVTEQLGLEQRVGKSRAVDRDERPASPRAAVVNQTRDDFLADAALAGDQHFGVTARRVIDFFFDAANRCTDSHQSHCFLHIVASGRE